MRTRYAYVPSIRGVLLKCLKGDIIMCAMLVLVAPRELKVPKSRVARFVEAYIGKRPWIVCSYHQSNAFCRHLDSPSIAHMRCVHAQVCSRRRHPVENFCKPFSSLILRIEFVDMGRQLQTTIYVSCAKCRKPMLQPAGPMVRAGRPSGSFAYCTGCRTNVTKCSIW